ncbi:MAG: YbaB/EbfC family nucleoid-associated protein [Oscillospiraceae bacterium]|nr:YbaB/EbfC family nucleoid-associated protein [Oscillospiraceae bacterium]
MKVRLPKNNNSGMGNIQELAKKAQEAQEKIDIVTQELENKEYSATSGGNAVKVIINGKPQVKSIQIDPSVVDANDLDMLSDMIIAATNEAIKKSCEEKNESMQNISGQLNIPGLF